MRGLSCLLAICGLSLLEGNLSAATLAHVSDFESENKDGWQHPVSNGNQTCIQFDGPFNDLLLVTSSGGSGAGSRLVVPNTTAAWTGDYTAAGITAVQMDLVNNSGSTLFMRVGIEGGSAGNRWTSSVPIELSPSDRGTFLFQLDASSLSSAGGSDLSATLADVSQIRILHNASSGDFKGSSVSGSFTVDNITLVPEPSSIAMLTMGLTTLLMRRKI